MIDHVEVWFIGGAWHLVGVDINGSLVEILD